MSFVYSICVINKNSVNTIQKALCSIAAQIDDEFQIVVVDESTDGSTEIIENFCVMMPKQFKLLKLGVDEQKGIGHARSLSIEAADGEYCILNIDCDDVWEPHIKDFVSIFRNIEGQIGGSFLLSGQQINVARRDFLLSVGSYRQIEHGEDRDLWMRLAKRNQYIPLDHVPFFTRLPLPRSTEIKKALNRLLWGVRDEIRQGSKFSFYLKDVFSHTSLLDKKFRWFRLLIFPLARFTVRAMPLLNSDEHFANIEEWVAYKQLNFGLYQEVAKLRGFNPSLDFLVSPLARAIFENRSTESTYKELKQIFDSQKS